MKYACTEKRFLDDVSEHVMTIHEDSDVFRHLVFAKPGTALGHFSITTWPGHLAISGDMGTFVFSRLLDMFKFFRSEAISGCPRINPGYWGEKCEAADRRSGGLDEFDPELFRKIVRGRYEDYLEASEDLTREQKRSLWKAVEDRILCAETEFDAYDSAARFEEDGFSLTDFWEHNLRSYTFRFIWCCYAIPWAIDKYDEAKKAVAA